MFHCELDGFRNIPLDGLHRKVSPGGPAVPHVRELDDLEAVQQHRLAQAARFHVDVVLGRGHEDLLALLLLRDNVKELYRVSHLVWALGWVNFDSDCSNVCLFLFG